MKQAFVYAVAALSIGVTSNLLASASGTQVSPSAINLSASGISEVSIHTQVPSSCVDRETVDVAINDDDGNSYLFAPEDVSFGADSLGHIIFNIDWTAFVETLSDEQRQELVGDVLFEAEGVCDTDSGAFPVSDDAKVIDESSNKKGR